MTNFTTSTQHNIGSVSKEQLRRKDTSMKKQKAKIYVFVDDVILFMAKTKPKNMLELFTSLLNLLNIQTAVFDRPIMNSLKEKSKRKSHLPMT